MSTLDTQNNNPPAPAPVDLSGITLDSINTDNDNVDNTPNPPTLDVNGNPPARSNVDGEDNTDPNAKPLVKPIVTPPAPVTTTDDTDTRTIKSFDNLLSVITTKTTDTLDDNEREELSSIVDTFGGDAFSVNGDILDEEGQVLYTAEQVQYFLTENELPLDADGNFVNAKGEIVKSTVELFRETTTVGSTMNLLARNFGVGYADDYMPEDTEESLMNVIAETINVIDQRSVANYFEKNPELESFRKHLLLNGSAEGYIPTAVGYDQIVVKDLPKEKKLFYISEAYKATGRELTPAYTAYLDTLSEEVYNSEVAANLNVLTKQQQNRQQELDTKLTEKAKQDEENAKQYWNNVTNTIKNGKLSNIVVPISEREKFLEYVTTPVENNKTKDMIDAEKEDIDVDLLMSYLRYKGYNLGALANNIANTNKVETLREKMNKTKTRNYNSDKGNKPRTHNNYIPSINEINK
jgi:hypothetical protein